MVEFGGHQDAAPQILMGAFYWFETLRDTDPFIYGDVNVDFSIDILDLLMLIDFIILDNLPNPSQLIISDYNADNVLDILDVMLIVNLILSD